MKKILSGAAFLVLLLLCLVLLYRPFSWKNTTGGYQNVLCQLAATGDDQIDLAFVGSSHIYCSVNPNVLWEQRGISAFDLSVSSMDKITTPYFLGQLFKTQSPRVVCLDLYALTFDRQDVQGNEYINYLVPDPSPEQLQTVLEYRPDDLAGYLTRWPIIHSRYRELTAFDFVEYPLNRFGRGNYYTFHVEATERQTQAIETSEVQPLSEANRTFLDKVIALCRENNAQLITAVMPFWVTPQEQAILNGAEEYLAAQGIECLDLNRESDRCGLDYGTDFADITHLNYQGARKVTRYLMEELCARYSFADHRGDAAYTLWEENSLYDAYQVQRHTLESLSHPDTAAVLQTVGTLPGFTAVVTVPAACGSFALSAPQRQALCQAGLPADALDAGGQWVLSGGSCLGPVPARQEVLSLDLNSVHNLTLNRDGAQSVELNGEACDVPAGELSVMVYDNYEAAVLLCCEG